MVAYYTLPWSVRFGFCCMEPIKVFTNARENGSLVTLRKHRLDVGYHRVIYESLLTFLDRRSNWYMNGGTSSISSSFSCLTQIAIQTLVSDLWAAWQELIGYSYLSMRFTTWPNWEVDSSISFRQDTRPTADSGCQLDSHIWLSISLVRSTASSAAKRL